MIECSSLELRYGEQHPSEVFCKINNALAATSPEDTLSDSVQMDKGLQDYLFAVNMHNTIQEYCYYYRLLPVVYYHPIHIVNLLTQNSIVHMNHYRHHFLQLYY